MHKTGGLLRAATILIALSIVVVTHGCGGSGRSSQPSIRIENPTSGPDYSTTSTGIRIGGSIAGASFVFVQNFQTGFTTEGFVSYRDGYGSWFADIYGLLPGANELTATTGSGFTGQGGNAALARLTVHRPDQPALLMLNGADRLAATTHWTDANAFGGGHEIALFGDGTGRATTGSTVTEAAGPVVDCTWLQVSPETIVITGPADCSFQAISRISGSYDEGLVFGQVLTVAGAGYAAIDAFVLTAGSL